MRSTTTFPNQPRQPPRQHRFPQLLDEHRSIERFWQTLKKWLHAHETPETLTQLQTLLDEFRGHYNQHRPHRALRGATPAEVFTSITKARPAASPIPAPLTIVTATVNSEGTVPATGAMINVGCRWADHTVTVIRDGNHTIIISGTRLVRELTIDPTRRFQPSGRSRHHELRGHREPHPLAEPPNPQGRLDTGLRRP